MLASSSIIMVIIIILTLIAGIFFYPYLPDNFAAHWNGVGVADLYLPKYLGIFILPTILIIIWLLFLFFYRLNPINVKEEDRMRHYFVRFVMLLFILLLSMYLLTILWNLGYRFNMIQMLSPVFALFFGYTGVMLTHCRRNWFIGIRTPWTLRSVAVWNETHRVAGGFFMIAGVITFFGVLFPLFGIWFLILPFLLAALLSVYYSYYVYKRIGGDAQDQNE